MEGFGSEAKHPAKISVKVSQWGPFSLFGGALSPIPREPVSS